MSGWIKLHRKTLESSIFDNPHLLKMWMWCLLKASHKSYKQLVGLEEIELNEGQFITGRHKGSVELKVNPSTWYKHLKLLESMSMIDINSNNKMTVVSIVNWGLYQGNGLESNNEITTNEQQNNTNKNVKNVKKEPCSKKPVAFNEDTIEYQLSKRLYDNMLLNDSKAKEPNLYKWAEHIDKLIRLDGRSVGDIKRIIDFATNDIFWRTNILSTNKLRIQFPALYLKEQQSNKVFKVENANNNHRGTDKRL